MIKMSNYIEIFDEDVVNVLYYLSAKFGDHDLSPCWYFSLFPKFCPKWLDINWYQLIFSCLFSAEKFHPKIFWKVNFFKTRYENSTLLKLLHLSKCTSAFDLTISGPFVSSKLSFFNFRLISIDINWYQLIFFKKFKFFIFLQFSIFPWIFKCSRH